MARSVSTTASPGKSPPDDLKSVIEKWARGEGFEVAGFVRGDRLDGWLDALKGYLARQYQGSMDWLAREPERRSHPRQLWSDVRSIVVLGMNYAPDTDPLETLRQRSAGNISVYARDRDYHDVIKKRLKAVARRIHGELKADVKVFVDTAPVMEKPLAQAAGLGWQGKHTNLVSPHFGSWLFLGSIFTTLELASDNPHRDQCGSCRKCLDVCPTGAFPEPYRIDARKCISYLTIEHRGHIPARFRKAMGNRIYGCDDCLAVCPWNKFAVRAREAAFHPRDALVAPKLEQLATLDDAGFRTLFKGSPVKRIGRDRFVRNVLIALGNSGERALLPTVKSLMADPSPLVRAMAVWTLQELGGDLQAEDCRARRDVEDDAGVLGEWERCLAMPVPDRVSPDSAY